MALLTPLRFDKWHNGYRVFDHDCSALLAAGQLLPRLLRDFVKDCDNQVMRKFGTYFGLIGFQRTEQFMLVRPILAVIEIADADSPLRRVRSGNETSKEKSMNKLFATTALTIALMGGSAYAATMAPITMYEQQPTDIQASKFIGMRLYATENAVAADTVVKPGAEKDWDDIGEVKEVILSRQGEVRAVVLGVGGFLGIGEKDVAIPMKDIKFVKDGDDADDYFLVVNTNKQMLTDAPAYTAPADMASTSSTTAAPAGSTAKSATPATDMALVRPDVKRDGYRSSGVNDLTSDNLTGAKVYGAKDEDIGEVDKLVLNSDGTVKQVVMDIGGFLGMGEHRIAVPLEQVSIMRNEKGDDIRVYVDSTADRLRAQPEYNGG